MQGFGVKNANQVPSVMRSCGQCIGLNPGPPILFSTPGSQEEKVRYRRVVKMHRLQLAIAKQLLHILVKIEY